jgi:hypothetical protein
MERLRLSQSQLLAQANTSLGGLLETNQILATSMADLSSESATYGVRAMRGPGAGAGAIVGGTEEDFLRSRMEAVAEGAGGFFSSIYSGLADFGKKAAEQGSVAGVVAAAKPKTEEEKMAATPVGLPSGAAAARTAIAPPPGTRAGMGALPGGGPELPLPAPAGPEGMMRGAPGAVNPMEYFMTKGEFPPLTVEHSPIEVNINLNEPFNQKVRMIAEDVYEKKTGGTQRQRQGGVAASK